MKALALTGIRNIEIVERPAPALQHPTDVLLRIIRIVEHHCGHGLGRELRPIRNPFVIGIARPGELYPCVGHIARQRARIGTASCHGCTPVGVVKHEWQLGAVKGLRASVEHRRLPRKPV